MVNSELAGLCGRPLNASEGKLTRSDNEASGRGKGSDLGMKGFSPRKGANTNGTYLVSGVNDPYQSGSGPKRSSLRAAGESR